jgi:hypothetical protein
MVVKQALALYFPVTYVIDESYYLREKSSRSTYRKGQTAVSHSHYDDNGKLLERKKITQKENKKCLSILN